MHNICKATTSLRGPCQPKKWIVCIAFSSALHCYNRRYSWGSLVTHNRKRIQDVAVGNICCWKSCPPLFMTRSLQFLIHQRFPTHHIRCLHLGWYVLGVEKLQVEENHQDHFFLLQLYITQYTWRLVFLMSFPPQFFPCVVAEVAGDRFCQFCVNNDPHSSLEGCSSSTSDNINNELLESWMFPLHTCFCCKNKTQTKAGS